MIVLPRTAMVLAAGLGTRLRPVTETIPKPLIEINGRSLLDHAIDRLTLVGVERVVVNVHYKAAMVVSQLARRDHPRIEISHETELLDTGGGVARALPLLDDTFFVVNSDVFWLDGKDRACSGSPRPSIPSAWTQCYCCSGRRLRSATKAAATI